jgi:hypothetical protein
LSVEYGIFVFDDFRFVRVVNRLAEVLADKLGLRLRERLLVVYVELSLAVTIILLEKNAILI